MLNRKYLQTSKYPFLGNNDRLSVDFSPPRACYLNSACHSPLNRQRYESLLDTLKVDHNSFYDDIFSQPGGMKSDKVSVNSYHDKLQTGVTFDL